MRLLKGSITIEDIDNMPRRDLIARIEARIRALKRENKQQQAARTIKEKMEGF